MPSSPVPAGRRLLRPVRRLLRTLRRRISWALVRPEAERLHDFLSAQLMESHEYTARSIRDLMAAVDRDSVTRAYPTHALATAYAHRALAALRPGSHVLEIGLGISPLAPSLAKLGYSATLVSQATGLGSLAGCRVITAPLAEAGLPPASFHALLVLGYRPELLHLSDLSRLAAPGSLLVLSQAPSSGDLDMELEGWQVLDSWVASGTDGWRFVTAKSAD